MPLLYAILGSSPLLVVGPEAAGSLLTGTIVKTSVKQGHSQEDDEAASAMVVGIATAMAGAMILVAGLTRLGFLDNVLSRPFLRGFITAIGFVIFVDQLIPEVGLADLAKEAGVSHGSTVQKLVFFAQNIKNCHGLTAAVSFGSFAIIMLFRYVPYPHRGHKGDASLLTLCPTYLRTIKKALEPRYPQVVYFPDRILVVILSAILTWRLGWYEQGLEVLGSVQNTATGLFAFRWPFQLKHLKHVRTAMSTSFIIAILGFFESSVAAKGLGERRDGVQGMSVSANREMVALGVANVVGGCFMALPAFGGYGRSKVNASTGARSPMSSIFLSVITFIVIMVLLPYLYYLPVSSSPFPEYYWVRHVLISTTESCTMLYDIGRRIQSYRGMSSRRRLLHPAAWLDRACINASHLRLHYILLAGAGYRAWHWALNPDPDPSLHPASHPNSRENSWDIRPIRQRRNALRECGAH